MSRCQRCGELPAHNKSKKGLCLVCLRASNDKFRETLRAARQQQAGRYEEAEDALREARRLAAVTPPEPDTGWRATVILPDARATIAKLARERGEFGPNNGHKGLSKRFVSCREAIAFAGAIAAHGLAVDVHLKPPTGA